MNEFVLSQTNKESNFNFTQLPEYKQQQNKSQNQDLGINFDMSAANTNTYGTTEGGLQNQFQNNNNQVYTLDINPQNIPSKLQNVNVEYTNVVAPKQNVFSNGGQYISKDSQGALKETHRKNPTQVKEFIPEDYNYGDDFHNAVKIGQIQQQVRDFKNLVPKMRQARVEDTLKTKGVDLDRAKGEFNPTFEVDQIRNNHDMLQTYEMSQYNQNEQYGNAYYKRIEAEALNRTNQTSDHRGVMKNQLKEIQNISDPTQLKFMLNPYQDEAKKVKLREYLAQNSFDIMKYDPKQNPCLANYLAKTIQKEAFGVLPQLYTQEGGRILNPDKSIIQNNRPQVFQRSFQYNNKLGGRIINPDKSIIQNNRPQIFERTYGNNIQPDMFKRSKGSNYNFAMTQNWASRNLAGATYNTNINYDPLQNVNIMEGLNDFLIQQQ